MPAVSAHVRRYATYGVALVVVGVLATRAPDFLRDHGFWPGSSRSAAAAGAVKPMTFAWVPVPRARSYKVEFALDGRVIYVSRTRRPRLRLRTRWTYRAHRYTLKPGAYHWYVWPIFRTAKGSHRGPPSVSSTLTIPG
jgi:hypothetical protein